LKKACGLFGELFRKLEARAVPGIRVEDQRWGFESGSRSSFRAAIRLSQASPAARFVGLIE